ncbi:CocE/NonD family hydrolase [Streptomyces sp. NPDC017936]|uniref:CocE/NonD family hydrolase n=1 Tax=Streptomyces sp. NPDC017936 TaxID=3365016 RepID=UPI0037976837
MANSVWRVADRWAPGDTAEVLLQLGRLDQAIGSREGGSLARGAVSGPAAVSWIHDPTHPVPWLVRSEWRQCADLPDESVVYDREDVATFTSQAQETSVEIVGHVTAELQVEAPTSRTHVVTRLLDVYPSGRARLIVEGAAVAPTRSGQIRAEVDLGDTAYLLRQGHALRLAVSASCFPLYAVHRGTDGDLWNLGATTLVRQTLHSDRERPSLLRLFTRGGRLGSVS